MKSSFMMVDGGGLMDQRKGIMKIRHVNNKVRYVKRPIKKKNNRSSYRERKDPKVLQKLFDSCREVFKGPETVPSDSDVNKLCSILDEMKPKHVGLSKNMQFFKSKSVAKGTPSVAYMPIYQCDEFSLCIFFIAANAVIPLHNHPGMTVFSKLLLGDLHKKSYDWVDSMPPPESQRKNLSFACKSIRTEAIHSCISFALQRDWQGGNIHEFRAVTPCAVLDVLGPPYSKDDRDCSYYKELQHSALSDGESSRVNEGGSDSLRWLKEIEMPQNSHMERIDYWGPQIVD
ncbi:plant cysteine oxidase 2-like [Gossypium australe]|uniref:cysteine dioxygenase n=1 Tax=Gossypium australe TaxID=47621 RepID=A0A5B6VHV1_9ROSI|nr:plant cysteine oxidase 2-like [Gossypium australe]